MSYSKRHEWCSSSIPTTLCPSNVDKSTQPCPLLSSAFSSTLLITNSNSHSVSINTDTISSAFDCKENDQLTTYVLSSSLDYSHDYYTKKRIEQLHNHMDDIQISNFLKFINYHLSSKHEKKIVKDLSQDLSNGHILIDLIEIFSSTKLKREYGRTRFHSLTNVQYVLDYLKLHMQHINISPQDIVSGNRKQILALLWIIMKIFDFPSFHITTNKHIYNENTIFSFGQDRSLLLKWINNLLNKILNTNIIYIKDFYIQTWINSKYLILIIKYLCPCSLKYGTLEYFEYINKLDEFNLSNNQKEYFQLCLNLSNYCFNTIITIDYSDRTEKSLFQFFSQLKQTILFILKSNHIGKLTKTNPYTKQLYDTVLETTNIEHSQTMNENDDYLIYNEHKQQQSTNPLDEKENSPSLNNDVSNNDPLPKEEENTISIEKLEPITIEIINSEESVVNTESLLSSPNITNITQEQQLISQNPLETISSINDENLHNQSALKSRKIKKKKSSTLSIEKLASTMVSTPTSNDDLFVKIIECLRNRKLITFKYIFILACLCFSILIIFIHK